MAGNIKGITIEFSADMSKLNAGLKKANGAISKTQAELKSVNRALKFNPANTTLLKQKFDLLKQSVSQTEDKLKVLKQQQAKMNAAGVDKTSAEYRKLERDIIKCENQLEKAQGDLRKFGSVGKQQALAVGNAFKTAGNKIKSAGRTITTSVSVYGMAGIYAGSKLIELSQQQAQAEQKLTEIYKTRMGATDGAAKSTMKLASALQQQGVVGDEVALSFAQQMATYSSVPATVDELMPAFENLLVQQKGLNGTQEDAVGLANMFGKAMMGQTGALKRAGISFTDAQAEVLKYGTEEERAAMIAEVVTQNVGNMNSEFAKTDAGKIQQAKNALGDMGEEIGAILLPAVADLVSWFQDNLMPKIQQFIDFMKQHPQLATFALALAGITAVMGPLLMIFGSFVSIIGGLMTIIPALSGAFAFLVSPIGLVVAGIAAAIAIGVLLYKNWDTIKKYAIKVWTAIKNALQKLIIAIVTNFKVKFMAVKTFITTVFNSIKTKITTTWTNIKTKIGNTVTGIKDKVTSVFTSLKEKVGNTFKSIKEKITKPISDAKEKVSDAVGKIKDMFPFHIGKVFSGLKLPHFKITDKGKIPYGILGKGRVPSWSVSWYKKAMNTPYLFSNPTLFGAGEAGDEVMYGRANLMKDIAQAVGGGGGITVNVYGSDGMSVTELANAVERKLIQAQKRRTDAWA